MTGYVIPTFATPADAARFAIRLATRVNPSVATLTALQVELTAARLRKPTPTIGERDAAYKYRVKLWLREEKDAASLDLRILVQFDQNGLKKPRQAVADLLNAASFPLSQSDLETILLAHLRTKWASETEGVSDNTLRTQLIALVTGIDW